MPFSYKNSETHYTSKNKILSLHLFLPDEALNRFYSPNKLGETICVPQVEMIQRVSQTTYFFW